MLDLLFKKYDLNYAEVKLEQPHFLISYCENYEAPRKPIAVMQATDNAPISLLFDNIDPAIVKETERTVGYYLFDKGESNPIGYLCALTTMMANVYSNIHFTYIGKITSKNIIYFIRNQSRLCDISDAQVIDDCNEIYDAMSIHNIFNKDILHYHDKCLRLIASYIFEKIPHTYNFTIDDAPEFEEFKTWFKGLKFDDFAIILRYLIACDYISIEEDEVYYALVFFIQSYHTNKEL